ncbi:MAG: hypothetical protein P0S96_04220 [Simkaniaceae bacterium]|nr:hypothetical protein [Candidatus Sacchlamyda saccharinae]
MKKKNSTNARLKEIIAKAAKSEIQKAKKARNYKHEEVTPLSQGFDSISIQPKKSAKAMPNVVIRKEKGLNLEKLHCTQSQNTPLFYIERAESMRLKNVQSIKAKERLIALRNIRKMTLQIHRKMHQKVQAQGENSEELAQLLHKSEERLFQIDRTIRYLSNV